MVNWSSLDYAKRLRQAEGESLYKGIVRLIRDLITEGLLCEGDSLPTQRDFAAMAGISRGTVSLAYDELRRDGIVTAVPGRGSVISSDRYVRTASRKEQAIRLLSNTLDKLEGLGFSTWEIEAFIHLLLQERLGQGATVRGLFLDCSPEALCMLTRQLSSISHLELTPMLMEDLPKQQQAYLESFDLVITTEHHESQVMVQMAKLQSAPGRLISVAVSPTGDTTIAMARVASGTPIVIHTESPKFGEVIRQQLERLGQTNIQVVLSKKIPSPEEIQEPNCLVAPQLFLEPLFAEDKQFISKIIPFDYQVDRGSLLRVEEAVTTLLLSKS